MDRETPWKELIEQYPEWFTAFFYADVHADIDWTQGAESLEQEFRRALPESIVGKKIVDKLLKVVNKAGDARYLHYEVQGYKDDDFPRRMYVYGYKGDERFGQPLVQLPILIDDDPNWVPEEYVSDQYGSRVVVTFLTRKVINRWRGKDDELLADVNPVALFVLAFLKGKEFAEDQPARGRWMIRLMQTLRELVPDELEAGPWLGFFRWLLPLSKEYNARLAQEMNPDEKEKAMPLISYWEEVGIEKGRDAGREEGKIEGLIQAVALGLDLKFGVDGLALMPRVEKVEDLALLQKLYDAIKPATSLDDIRQLLPAETNGQH